MARNGLLQLFGPGALSVVGVNGTVFNKSTQTSTDSIQTITVGGAITTQTRLVGTVHGTTGQSNVYFENLNVTPTGELGKIDLGQVNNFRSVQNGIFAIDMPDFYLAHTDTATPSTPSSIHTNAMSAGQIFIPQGVLTLRFGGVNVDYTPPGGTPLTQTNQNNEFQIDLGLPIIQGTSIIVNTVNSDAQANTTTATQPFQDYATFLVGGRLNLFQANQITGNTTPGLVPSQFPNQTPATTSDPGGTYLFADGTTGGVTGQIGDLRIGGAATNFTTLISENPENLVAAEGQLDAKISNFFIGGQTKNVLLVAPSGARNIVIRPGHGQRHDQQRRHFVAIGQPRRFQFTGNREPLDRQLARRRRRHEHEHKRRGVAEPLHICQRPAELARSRGQRCLLWRTAADRRETAD